MTRTDEPGSDAWALVWIRLREEAGEVVISVDGSLYADGALAIET